MSAVPTCPLCGHPSPARYCCGIDLGVRVNSGHWRMTPERIHLVRAVAHGRKGLDDDTYRLYLGRVQARHTGELSREQFQELLRALNSLPDCPNWTGGRHARR
jgi:hypothetical protein